MTILENNKDYGIKVFENFITDDDCKYLINFLDNTQDSFGNVNEIRKVNLRPESEKIKNILLKVLDKAKKDFNNNNLFISSYMISSYNPGYYMGIHVDTEDMRECNKISMLLYLNNDFKGGDIVFPIINFKHSPKAKELVCFLAEPKENAHGVEIIDSGKRYVMPIFITDEKENASKFIHSNTI
jgi:hypothetical protein